MSQERTAAVNLTEKQIGTVIAALQMAIADREMLKKIARVKHLNNIDDELKLLISLESLLVENN